MTTSTPPTTRPRRVTVAFWLYMAAALATVVGVVGAIAIAPSSRTVVRKALEAQGKTATTAQIQAAIDSAITLLAIYGVIFVLAFLVFGLYLRSGRRWARIALTVTTVLSIISLTVALTFGIVQTAVAIVALVLMWTGSSRAWFLAARPAGRLR